MEQSKASHQAKISRKINKASETVAEQGKERMKEEKKSVSELTPIERVKIMNDFASAAMDEDLKAEIYKRPNGAEIYEVFVMAMNNKISAIMDNDPLRYQILSEVTEKAAQANEVMDEVNANLVSLANILKALSGSGGARTAPPASQPPVQQTSNSDDPRARAEEVRRAQQEYAQRQSAEQSSNPQTNMLINGI